MAKTCHDCGNEWTDKRSPGFREECLKCGAPLHCCANCRFFDESAYEWCREPQARDLKPRDAEGANTCEYFLFADSDNGRDASDREAGAKAGLAALFGEDPQGGEKPADMPDWMKTEPKDDNPDIFG